MPFIEKFPQTTTVIVAGWTNPDNALRFNGSYAYTETDLAEQEYDGYGFQMRGNPNIDKVFIRIKEMRAVTTVIQGDDSSSISYVEVYDGSSWNTYQVSGDIFNVSTGNDESLTSFSGNAANSTHAIDVTAFLNTVTKINSAKTRLKYDILTTSAGITLRWSVDCISILVCYSPSSAGTTIHERPTPRVQLPLRTLRKYLQVVGG